MRDVAYKFGTVDTYGDGLQILHVYTAWIISYFGLDSG